MTTLRVPVSGQVIQWAITHGERSEDELRRAYRLDAWLDPRTESDLPTFEQLQRFSRETRVPFDYFFEDQIPEETSAFLALRTVNDPTAQPSRRLIETIYALETRQAWMKDYILAQGVQPPFRFWRVISEEMGPVTAAKRVSDLLDLSGTFDRRADSLLAVLRTSISQLGILVMQNGVVGTDSQRPLAIDEFRAIALSDAVSPLIFINDADNGPAKVFSLIHEFVHILLGRSEILNVSLADDVASERWINQVTLNVLLPELEIRLALTSDRTVADNLKFLVQKYPVGPVTAAMRLRLLGACDQALVDWARAEQRRGLASEAAGPSCRRYEVDPSRIDRRFAKAVIDCESRGELSLVSAASMLDVPLRAYDGLVGALLEISKPKSL
ncbi:ImmA/IrrE family metallo-endopeptidase [Levilactobacillus yiduensis]|uniref:ImmA/IrrE family metallo-endopeptidase n=1 Tax=Levilactobacillus yiduensis TaxID=2953880 RepID=UPI0021584F49|nr:ImmA/IrrE family metallo-endopeptidase [Levilactobacillus yiduensis]